MSTRKRRQAATSLSISASTSSGTALLSISEEPPVVVVETQQSMRNNNNVLHHISDYEAERLNNIKRNEEFLASLGISEVKSSMASTAAANKPTMKKKVVRVKKVSSNINIPVRRSGRVTIDKLQEEIAVLENSNVQEDKQMLESKKKELEEMMQRKYDRTSFEVVVADSEANRWQRLSTDPILLTSMLYSEDDYEKDAVEKDLSDLVTCMKANLHDHDSKNCNIHIDNNKDKKRKGAVISTDTSDAKESVSLQEYKQQLNSLSLVDTDVAKLVQDRVTAVYIHPSEVKTIVIAGDKSGHVSVWDVDKSGTSSSSSSVDGIYKYRPHISNIAKICCSALDTSSSSSSSAAVYTTSYDGTIRHLDLNHDAFTTVFAGPEDLDTMYFTDASFCNDHSQCVYVSTSDGCIAFIDLRASSSAYQSKCPAFSSHKLNSIQQHPTMSHLLISSEKSSIYIYDNRHQSFSNSKPLKPLNTLSLHSKSINAAYTSYDGHSLVSISQDNTIRSWTNFIDPTSDSHSVVIRHDNITGRWLSTFRPAFDPKSPSTFIVGSMLQPRRVDVFHLSSSSTSSFTSSSSSSSDAMTSSTKRSKSTTTTPSSVNEATMKHHHHQQQMQSIDMIHNLSNSDYLNSVCSRNAFHNTKHIIACGNSSGRIHVFR